MLKYPAVGLLAMLSTAIASLLTACQRQPAVAVPASAPVKAKIARAEGGQLYTDKVGEVGGSQKVTLRATASSAVGPIPISRG